MNRIFCLETEWDQSKHDLKMKSAVLPLLEFVENKYNLNVPHTFRQVATEADFAYYIRAFVQMLRFCLSLLSWNRIQNPFCK